MIKICPNCGNHVLDTIKFCTRCGADLRNVPAAPENRTLPQQSAAMGFNTPSQPSGLPGNPYPAQPFPNQTSSASANDGPNPGRNPNMGRQMGATANSNYGPGYGQGRGQNQPPQNPYNTQNNRQPYGRQPQPPYQKQQNSNRRITPEATKDYATNYWAYLLDGLKHPFTMAKSFNRFFGLTTLILSALFLTFSLALSLRSVPAIKNSFYKMHIGANLYIQFFIFFVLFYVILVGISYLGTYFLLNDHHQDILSFTNRFSHIATANVFIAVLLFLLAVLGLAGHNTIIILLSLEVIIMGTAFTGSIFGAQSNSGFDRAYVYIIAIAVALILTLIIFKIIGGNILDVLSKGYSLWTGSTEDFATELQQGLNEISSELSTLETP